MRNTTDYLTNSRILCAPYSTKNTVVEYIVGYLFTKDAINTAITLYHYDDHIKISYLMIATVCLMAVYVKHW